VTVAIAAFGCESVSISPALTGLDDLERMTVHGDPVIEAERGTNTCVSGFIEVLEKENAVILPVFSMALRAMTTVTDEAYVFFVRKLVRLLGSAAPKLDGILLSFHGAMVTESRPDPETDALREIRKTIGYELPIMVTLDLHANKDTDLLKEATALFAYHSSPHVDMRTTGRRAAGALVKTIRGEIRPVTALKKPAIVVPSVFSATTVPPGRTMMKRVRKWEAHPGVVDVSVLFGFAWAHMPGLGMSVIAVTDDNAELAERIAEDLCCLAAENGPALTGKIKGALYSVEEGVRHAKQQAEAEDRPVVILDHADRTGDTTFVLREMIKQRVEKAALPLFYDPGAAEACIAAGRGAVVTVDAGASTGWLDGGPVRLTGKVLWAGPGHYTGTGPMWKNLEIDLGPTAIVETQGIWVQFVSRRMPLVDTDPFVQFGYEPADFSIIVTKSKTHFRAVYEKIASGIVVVDAPGQCSVVLKIP
jgi:microcystin degradation protein MlrC